jgi:tRNA threonylcarbamoyladenosine biosynthesis protein TsaE
MPILDAHALEFFSRSAEQTRRIGLRLGGFLQAGDAVCLQGELGAGKTTLVQGLAHGWGALDEVSSPTFVLVNMYRRADQGVLFHLDAYRLDAVKEAEQLDLDSMLSQGPLLVEWPERLEVLIPVERLWINLDHVSEQQRQMLFRATGPRYDALLNEVRQSVVGAG